MGRPGDGLHMNGAPPGAETAVAVLAIIQLVIIGVSHIVQPRAWVQFFLLLRGKGHAGVFVVAFMSLWFGSIIVAFHNVWSGVPVILTLIGWAQVLKALIYFAFPAFALRRLALLSEERGWMLAVGGVVLVAVGALLAYDLLAAPGGLNRP